MSHGAILTDTITSFVITNVTLQATRAAVTHLTKLPITTSRNSADYSTITSHNTTAGREHTMFLMVETVASVKILFRRNIMSLPISWPRRIQLALKKEFFSPTILTTVIRDRLPTTGISEMAQPIKLLPMHHTVTVY